MKKIIIVAFAFLLATPVFAQKNNKKDFWSIENHWTKFAGFSAQAGYPYGFSLAGGSFLSVGFGDKDKQYNINANEYREATWSLRCGWLGYTFGDQWGWEAITFRPMLVMGIDRAKVFTRESAVAGWDSEKKTYFTMAPTLVVNVYMLHFSVGYEIVPNFKELNGLNWGVGFSIPVFGASDRIEKWADDKKNKANL